MLAPFALSLALVAAAPAASASEPVTYVEHVATILHRNCAECHRPGAIAPFSLLTYEDAAKRADFLVEVTSDRRMPPWKPEPGPHFVGERRLSEGELATLKAWAQTGAKEGDRSKTPPPPEFKSGWQLGTPDLVLSMKEAFALPADGRDVQQCFAITIPIEKDRYVAAVEFRPGNARIVHHALFFLDSTGQAKSKDPDGKGYRSFGGPGIVPTGGLGGWAPGARAQFLPEGMAKFLSKGSDLLLQIHYHPSGKAETDQSQVAIYFAKEPVKQIVTGVAVRSRMLYIPAGEKRHHVTAESAPLPVESFAVGVSPHMHNLGREMKVVAVPPLGEPIPLIHITDWDFNWQGQYLYESPVRLPAGTVIKVDAYYDNSADNPQNPNDPPKPVRWGEQTTDEMCLLGVQVVTNSLADLRQIASMRGNFLGVALSGGVPPKVTEADIPKIIDQVNGIPIPDRFKAVLSLYDADEDNRLSNEEIDKMPAPLKERVQAKIREVILGRADVAPKE